MDAWVVEGRSDRRHRADDLDRLAAGDDRIEFPPEGIARREVEMPERAVLALVAWCEESPLDLAADAVAPFQSPQIVGDASPQRLRDDDSAENEVAALARRVRRGRRLVDEKDLHRRRILLRLFQRPEPPRAREVRRPLPRRLADKAGVGHEVRAPSALRR